MIDIERRKGISTFACRPKHSTSSSIVGCVDQPMAIAVIFTKIQRANNDVPLSNIIRAQKSTNSCSNRESRKSLLRITDTSHSDEETLGIFANDPTRKKRTAQYVRSTTVIIYLWVFLFHSHIIFMCFSLFSCGVRMSTERPDVLDEEAAAVIVVRCAARCSQFSTQIPGVNATLLRFSPFIISDRLGFNYSLLLHH